jgi:hypothetical protein
VLATIRNIVIHEYLRPEHEYVLWLDADVVKYPRDLILRMYETNPHGVTAPLVVIESSDADWYALQIHTTYYIGLYSATYVLPSVDVCVLC